MKSVTTALPGAARITYPYIFPPAPIFFAAAQNFLPGPGAGLLLEQILAIEE